MPYLNRSASSVHKHLAAISPYSNINKQPLLPRYGDVHSAIYLFRHGIIEVSRHDYVEYIAPFLRKLCSLQKAGYQFVKRRLSFLSSYQSWITEAHVGMVSDEGLKQCSELGSSFRIRYRRWLIPKPTMQYPTLDVWTDSATRCQLSAVAFADAFSGKTTDAAGRSDLHLQPVNSKVKVLHDTGQTQKCDNLSWHIAFAVDQTAGHEEFEKLMEVLMRPIHYRLKSDWIAPISLEAKDIYTMQLLHSYNEVAQRPSPFNLCFYPDDWSAFEYLRDVKYHFSEGYGAAYPGFYAIPWMKAAITSALAFRSHRTNLPLRIAFSHREEVLYLCCLLGINFDKGWEPNLEKVDRNRRWRASLLAPYLGHVDLETYGHNRQMRIRVVINGEVKPAFFDMLEQDSDGGYDIYDVNQWVENKFRAWQNFNSSRITFLR